MPKFQINMAASYHSTKTNSDDLLDSRMFIEEIKRLEQDAYMAGKRIATNSKPPNKKGTNEHSESDVNVPMNTEHKKHHQRILGFLKAQQSGNTIDRELLNFEKAFGEINAFQMGMDYNPNSSDSSCVTDNKSCRLDSSVVEVNKVMQQVKRMTVSDLLENSKSETN